MRLKSYAPPRAQPVEASGGPFTAMRAGLDGSPDPQVAEWLHNCLPMNPLTGGPVIARPGRRTQGVNPVTGLPTQVGGTGTDPRACQMLTYYAAAGTMVAISAGQLWKQDLGSGHEWGEWVDAATLAAAGVTLNNFTRYGVVEFNERLVICGSDVAFTVDASGSVVKLTNAGTNFTGRPTVYAGKVFFIRAGGQTIVWSEEGDETTGYEAGGFANAWDLDQTSPSPITALMGTNAALYVFRTRGITAIFGGSADQFQTTATQDAVSPTMGTLTADDVVLAHDTIWFADINGRPHYFAVGSTEVIPAWRDIERLYSPYREDSRGYFWLAAPNVELGAVILVTWMAYVTDFDLVLLGMRTANTPNGTGSAADFVVGYHARTRRAQTVWTFPTAIERIVQAPRNVFQSTYLLDAYGYAYMMTPGELNDFSTSGYADRDDRDGSDHPVVASLIGPRHFNALGAEVRVKRLDAAYLGVAGGALAVRWATPEVMAGGGVTNAETATLPPAPPAEPMVLTASGLSANVVGDPVPTTPGHVALGLNERCRWIAFAFSWDSRATKLRMLGWTVTGRPERARPRGF